MKINSMSDIGTTRPDNQDNYWNARLSVNGSETSISCVCDGMGGLQDGGLASKIVVESIRDSILAGTPFSELEGVLVQANKAIRTLSKGKRMGTTCTVLGCSRGRYEIYHIGDSRCYLVRNGKMESLTVDHSALVKYNITKENPDLYKKYKNKLTRCIGLTKDIEVDYIRGEYFEGDIFLVCSDGVWHYFETNSSYIIDCNKLQELVDLCKQSGEKDNMTVVTCRIERSEGI